MRPQRRQPTSLPRPGILHIANPWRRKWQPTPVFLPGKSHEWRSLLDYSTCGCRVGHDWATWLSLFFFFMTLLLEAQVRIWSHDHFSSFCTWLHVGLFYSLDGTAVWQFSVKVVLYVDADAFFISLWERLISMSSISPSWFPLQNVIYIQKMHKSYVKFVNIKCEYHLSIISTLMTNTQDRM